MAPLIKVERIPPLAAKGSRVVCAALVPGAQQIVAATDAHDILFGNDIRVNTSANVRAIACVKYAFFAPEKLPDEKTIVLALINGVGLQLFSFPSLERLENRTTEQLADLTRSAHTFAIDTLGADLVNESFRIAIGSEDSVLLLDVNLPHNKIVELGRHFLPEKYPAVAFSEMTIVASTSQIHYLLRISRGGGLAVAATVNRSERPKRKSASSAMGDGSAAVVSFFGGLFGRRDLSYNITTPVAFALPDNRWLLVVDHELVTFSSFGAKLDEMENVFRSKTGMEVTDNTSSSADNKNNPLGSSIARSASVSSLGSAGTAFSHRTFLDEAQAMRADKPPVTTVFASPFVLSVSAHSELLAFAANGSVQGVMERIQLIEDDEPPEDGVKLLSAGNNHNLAAAYWPSGKVVVIQLCEDLDTLIEAKEASKELRSALALVPADQVDRIISLRRLLAKEARNQEWHDAAIYHMQSVANLSMRREGVDQLDLVQEAIDLRGPRFSGWESDAVTATMWADFLFRLRRRIMRPSSADVHVLETLCRADESSTRIRSLLSVKHEIPLDVGEALITSKNSCLREEERVEALVSLYTSLHEHGKALMLLENSETTSSFNGVAEYLSAGMKPTDDIGTFFSHLKWLAHEARDEVDGYPTLERLIKRFVASGGDSVIVLSRTFEVLVEEADSLLLPVIDGIYGSQLESKKIPHEPEDLQDSETHVSSDTLASALLAGMAKADLLEKKDVFDRLRRLFNSHILHHPEELYHSYTLLQALQTPENKSLGLHEELAFLLGRQGRHEAAADELAAETSLDPEEALTRLVRMLPASDKPSAAEVLVSAYLRVSAQGEKNRMKDASVVLKSAAGAMDIEKLLLEGRCSDESFTLREIQSFLHAALLSANERFRITEITRALRNSEVRRMQEEVMTRRRRVVLVGHDRACTLCTRRLGDSVFAAYPDGSVSHLACHMSKDSRSDSM